jgi:hypothetical protein
MLSNHLVLEEICMLILGVFVYLSWREALDYIKLCFSHVELIIPLNVSI